MPRRRPPERLNDLIAAATQVFIASGYRRAQMEDVARVLGVSKGALYLYVESKEALFDLVLRNADGRRDERTERALPVPTPNRTDTVGFVVARLAEESALPALERALARRRGVRVREELDPILHELFGVLYRNRTGLKLVDRCAEDLPELHDAFYRGGRAALVERFVAYLLAPARRRAFRSFTDTRTAARIVVETLMFWAVHRYWDPAPEPVDVTVAERTAVEFIRGALLAP